MKSKANRNISAILHSAFTPPIHYVFQYTHIGKKKPKKTPKTNELSSAVLET